MSNARRIAIASAENMDAWLGKPRGAVAVVVVDAIEVSDVAPSAVAHGSLSWLSWLAPLSWMSRNDKTKLSRHNKLLMVCFRSSTVADNLAIQSFSLEYFIWQTLHKSVQSLVGVISGAEAGAATAGVVTVAVVEPLRVTGKFFTFSDGSAFFGCLAFVARTGRLLGSPVVASSGCITVAAAELFCWSRISINLRSFSAKHSGHSKSSAHSLTRFCLPAIVIHRIWHVLSVICVLNFFDQYHCVHACVLLGIVRTCQKHD
jgi:hypothetical protein